LCIIASCSEDELSTDQLSDTGISLKAFGPNPVLRGGELRFVGTNMDKVTGIVIPGSGEVTTFTKKEQTEIRLTVPQNATEGYVVLHTPQGDITSKTMITFEEPIEIKTITTSPVKAGDVFTITGDYLNLIAKVVFQKGAAVDTSDHVNFISQSRQEITVKVPREAQSGEIMIANGASIPIEIYSEQEANIVLPEITSLSATAIKAGAELTITGANLDLVEKVIFGGSKDAGEFTLEGLTTITVTTPADAQDGAVTVVAYSGVEVPSTETLTLTVPTEVVIDPAIVKNGSQATITGNDLDLVTAITFGDVGVDAWTYDEGTITLTIPAEAAAEAATLVLASTKTVDIAVTYVTPVITSIDPTSLTAGDNLTITGTDLDLVSAVKIGDNNCVIESQSETSITVATPLDAATGTDIVLSLVLSNGTEIAGETTLTVNAPQLVVTSITPSSVKPGTVVVIDGVSLDKVTSIALNGQTNNAWFYNPSNGTIQLLVPIDAPRGKYPLTINGNTGGAELTVTGSDPVQDPALVIFDFEDGLANDGRWGGVGQESTEDGFGKYYEITAANWDGISDKYWWFADNWRSHPSVTNKSDYVVKMDVRLRQDIPAPTTGRSEVRVMISGQVVNILPYLLDEKGQAWEEGGLWTTGGDWKTISIELTEWGGLSDPTPESGGEWGIATWINESSFVGFCIDNIRYERK
jgi:hypothetical protein